MLLLHIGAFHLDIDSQQQTFWHSLTPQTRLLCIMLLLLAIVLTPNGHWLTWGVYAIAILAVLLVSKITWGVLIKRLAVEFGFVSVILLGTLFRDGGEVLWQWGVLKITTTGLTILGSVTLKSLLSLVLLNILTLTTAIPDLLQALVILKMPPLLVAILASMYRAAVSRNLLNHRRWQRLVLGNAIGSLFIRTYERGERVHQAMLARGYQGLPPIQKLPTVKRRDVVILTLTLLLALFGQIIYFIE